jgi:hypothetical protein
MQAAGVKVGQLPDEAARAREPLLHRRHQPATDLHARDDVAHACGALAKEAVADWQEPWFIAFAAAAVQLHSRCRCGRRRGSWSVAGCAF